MINMMYLVLTALLALNVSAEILNAFKTVNNSIGTSNKVVTDKNNLTYAAFDKAFERCANKSQRGDLGARNKTDQKVAFPCILPSTV